MNDPDQGSLKSTICHYLMRHTTMSLATCDDNRAWSTDLFYASDNGCRLYFVSSGTTRHCRHIADNPQVSASISGEYADWGAIKGLQLDGVASVVSQSDRDGVIETYLEKFPSLNKMHDAPQDEQERRIVARLLQGHFYRIAPTWIRMLDNSKGFGHKEEIIF